jgi:hypothetical protein
LANIKTACAARIVIFTNWAFGGWNAQFAKVQQYNPFSMPGKQARGVKRQNMV